MERFGKYEIVEEIGEGGFGKVYKGWDPVLKRHVAIKTCTWDDEAFRRRFVQEAELAGGLQHPNIVTVHDFGEEDGEPYLVQEFIEGHDLDELLARGEPAGLEAKIALLRQVAAGLGYAHEHDIVHRDVKPSNIRVGPGGRVSIMDFGIAKLLSADSGLTQTGMSIGTAGYSSPEQLEGGDIDGRADIFSFGVVAYELISGRRPFRGDTVSSLFYQIIHVDPPPLGQVRPDCPDPLARLVGRCLEKDPAARYGSFPEILRDLDVPAASPAGVAAAEALPSGVAGGRLDDAAPTRIARAADGSGSDERRPRSSRRAYLGLLLAAAAVAVFGILNLVRSSQSSPVGLPEDTAVVVDPPPDDPADGESPTDGSGDETLADAETGDAGDGTGGVDGTDESSPDTPEQVAEGNETDSETRPDTEADPTEDGGARPPAAQLRGVMVVIYGAEAPFYRVAENVIMSGLTESGHVVRDEVSGELRAGAAEAGMGLGELARAAGAAITVVGELRTDAVASVGGMFTGSAVLSLRAYDVTAGEVVMSRTFQVGAGDVPGKLGGTPDAARTEAVTQVGHQAAAALRAFLGR